MRTELRLAGAVRGKVKRTSISDPKQVKPHDPSAAVTLLTEGTCTIEADRPGDTQAAAAEPVVRAFTALAATAAQTLTFR